MKINLKDAFILDRYEKSVEFQLPVAGDEALASLAEFKKEPKVSFSIHGKYGLVLCDTVIDLEYTSYCCRCLSPVSGNLHIKNQRRMITDPLKEDEDTILIDKNFVFLPYEEAKNHAKLMLSIFGSENFYLEIQDHGIEEQKIVNEALVRMSNELGIGLVATNDVHYLQKKDAEAQAVLMCIQTNTVITEGKPIGFETNEFYLKSSDEISELFSYAPSAIENTVKIAEMCNFDFEFGKVYIPVYECPDGISPKEYLIRYRISKAKQLLNDAHHNISISEISNAVGIDNPLYFSRLFHQKEGVSPSDYKKSLLNKDDSVGSFKN